MSKDVKASFVTGRIALIQRDTCNFGVKVLNAEAAGATGANHLERGTPAAPAYWQAAWWTPRGTGLSRRFPQSSINHQCGRRNLRRCGIRPIPSEFDTEPRRGRGGLPGESPLLVNDTSASPTPTIQWTAYALGPPRGPGNNVVLNGVR